MRIRCLMSPRPLPLPTASSFEQRRPPATVARIKYDGTVQTEGFTAGSSGVQTGGNITGVYSPDGSRFYVSGFNGVSYFSSFTPSAALVAASATIDSTSFTVTGLELDSNNLALVGVQYGNPPNLDGQFVGLPKANTVGVANSTLTESSAGAGTTVTVTTTAANGLATGATVTIAGASVTGYNGTFPVTVTSSTTFTYTATTSGLANATGGTASEVLTLPGLPSTDTAQQFPIDVYFTHLNGTGAPAGVNTMYLSDDGPSFASGEITKWALVGGSWTLVDKITAGTGNAAVSFYWLNGLTDGSGNVTLYATYGQGGNANAGPGDLYSIIDQNGWNAPLGTGGTHSDALTTVASVGSTSNETFRGVASTPIAESTLIVDNGPTPSPLGTSVSFTVTVTGGQIATGGTVTLEDAANNNNVVGTGTLTNGTVTIPTTSLALGTDKIFAIYAGDTFHQSSQSSTVTHTVTPVSPDLLVTLVGTGRNLGFEWDSHVPAGLYENRHPGVGKHRYPADDGYQQGSYRRRDHHNGRLHHRRRRWPQCQHCRVPGCGRHQHLCGGPRGRRGRPELPDRLTPRPKCRPPPVPCGWRFPADGLGFWVATSTGVRYVPFGNAAATASTQVSAEATSPTAVGISVDGTTTGQLFGSAGAGAQSNGVPALDSPFTVGSGLPIDAGQGIAVSPSFPTARDAFQQFFPPPTNLRNQQP